MSVIIKNMDIPKSCGCCRFALFNGTCMASGDNVGLIDTRAESCPLVEIPEKHGDLIDAKAFNESVESYSSILPEERELIAVLVYNEPIIFESEE